MTRAEHPDASTPQTIRRLLPMTRGFRGSLGISLLCRLISQTSGVAALTVGAVLMVTDAVPLWQTALIMVGIALVKGLSRYAEQYFGHRVAFTVLARLRVRFFAALVPQAPAVATGARTGDLLSRSTRDIDRLEVFFAHTIVPSISAVLLSAGFTVAAGACAGWPIAATLALGLLLSILVALLYPRAGRRAAAADAAVTGGISQHISETCAGREDLRGLHAFAARGADWSALGERRTRAAARLGALARRRRLAFDVLWLATFVAVSVLAAVDVTAGRLTVAPAAVVLGLAFGAFASTEPVVGFVNEWRQVCAAAARVQSVLDATPAVLEPTPETQPSAEVASRASALTTDASGAEIRVHDLRFSRSASGVALQVPDLRIAAGAQVLIIGPSGSGKSTLLDLIARVWDADAGSISIAGVNVRSMGRADLVRRVAVIDQRTFVFTRTIAENLRIGVPDATDAQLLEVCRQVRLGELIERLPKGLDTVLGAGHGRVRLSGGQLQRLAVARALLTGAPILLADEITSQLDAETARQIRALVLDGSQGRTVLWVSHTDDAAKWPGPVVHIDEQGLARVEPAQA